MYIYECFEHLYGHTWICEMEVYIFVCIHEGLTLGIFYHHPTYLLSLILSPKPSKSLTDKFWLVWLSSLLLGSHLRPLHSESEAPAHLAFTWVLGNQRVFIVAQQVLCLLSH